MRKIYLLTIICMILLVSLGSAFEFDNTKSYDEKTKTVTVNNCDLWLFTCLNKGEVISEIKLLTPLRNIVSLGYTNVAKLQFEVNSDYQNPLKELELFDKNNGNRKFTRDYDYKVLTYENITIDDYDNVVIEITSNGSKKYGWRVIGNHQELREKWKVFDYSNFKEGDNLTIGIFTIVEKGDYVEWIPNFFGIRIEEWATFEPRTFTTRDLGTSADTLQASLGVNASFGVRILVQDDIPVFINTVVKHGGGDETHATIKGNNGTTLLAFAPFVGNNATFNNFTLQNNTIYRIGVTDFFNSFSSQRDNAVSFPIDLTEVSVTSGDIDGTNDNGRTWGIKSLDLAPGVLASPTVTLVSPIDFFNTTNSLITFNGTIGNVAPDNVTLFIDDVGNETNSTGILDHYQFTEIISEGTHTWNYQACLIDECVNGTARTFTIDKTKPSITLTSPIEQIDSHIIGNPLFLNWSIIELNIDACWFDYDNTNTTVTCNDNTTTFNTVENKQNLTFYANDTTGNENSSFTSWTYAFLEIGVDFNVNASETDNQFFELNVTTDINVLSISALLTYNGTNFTSTASCISGNCTISNTIDIPLVKTGEFENKSFFWNLVIFNGTDSNSITTSTRIQNVSRIHLESCNATFPTQTLNFTVHDEQTLERINPFSFDGFFEFWTGSGSIVRNNSISINDTQVPLCLSPNVTMKTDSIIDYDASTLTSYTNRFYYFDDKEINNISQDIFMYLLESASSTSFILKVQDESLLPVTSAIIEIHRWYPGEGIFRLVQIAKTDGNGKSIGFFETETVDYKFIIKKDGVILFETPDDERQKVVPEVSPFTLTFNTGDPLGEPWESQNEISDLNSTLVWDDTSGFVTYVYIDNSGDLTLARLLVTKESLVNSTNDTVICNEISSLFSATLSCNVGNNSGFYVASSFIDRGNGEGLDKQFTFQIQTLSSIVGLLGLFYGWFLVLIASFMFKFNEIAGIWAVTITVFLINLTGLINFGGVFVTGTIAVALILTWIMEK